MQKRIISLIVISMLVIVIFNACENREEKAQAMLIKTSEMLEGAEFKYIEIKEHLNKIISEYSETNAAITATSMHDKIIESANKMAQTALRSAFVAAVKYSVNYPEGKIDMIKLKEYGLTDFKDVDLKIVRSDINDFQITSEHLAGDSVYSIGSDGQILSQSKG